MASSRRTNKSGLFYSKEEERVNAWSHAAGIALGVGAGLWLFSLLPQRASTATVAGLVLYIIGMLLSYCMSVSYHSLRHRSHYRPLFRQLDHAAIYWHIAGSYSPIALTALIGKGAWGWGLFAFIWTCATIGTIASFRKMEQHSHIETACFLVMGFSVLAAFKPLIETVPLSMVWWLAAEGAAYSVGAAFYSVCSRRYMHSVFHIFVLLGSICHIGALSVLYENL